MKKIILCGTALLLSLGFAKAQTPGAFATYVYDDFAPAAYTATNNALGIYWWRGNGNASATDVRAASGTKKETFTYPSGVGKIYLEGNFGTNTVTNTQQIVNMSTMADIEIDVENTGTKMLAMRVIVKDSLGNYSEFEPNFSDCVGADGVPNPNVTWPSGWDAGNPAVYPHVAYNGVILPANTRSTVRFDLSSVAGRIGGGTWSGYTGGYPATEPATSYVLHPDKIHLVQFVINDLTATVPFSNGQYEVHGTADKGGYKYDSTLVGGQSDYFGAITFYSFKMGSCLSALPADADLATAITDASVIDNSLKVFPNPAKEVLNVSFDATTSATVSLSDLAGHTVYSTSASAGTNNMTINTSSVPTGMYILNISSGNGVTARKVNIR
jgi:hypothetical protein